MIEEDKAQHQLEVYLIVGIIQNILVPVVVRTGLVDLAEQEFHQELLRRLGELNAEQRFTRELLARHVDRTYRWVSPPKPEQVEEQRERNTTLNNSRVKLGILYWMAVHHQRAYKPQTVARELAEDLGVERSLFPELFRLYKELGFLLEPSPGKYKAVSPLIRLPPDDLGVRQERLSEFFSLLVPLGEAYLIGDADAFYAKVSLPPDLWRDLSKDVLCYSKERLRYYVEQGNLPNRDSSEERKGAIIVASGPVSWNAGKGVSEELAKPKGGDEK